MTILLTILKALWSRPGLLALGFIAGFGWGWHKFDKAADRAADRATIAELTKQMQALHAVADAANERASNAAKEVESLNAQVTAYAEELSRVPAPNAPPAADYRLTKRDVQRLCNISPASCQR